MVRTRTALAAALVVSTLLVAAAAGLAPPRATDDPAGTTTADAGSPGTGDPATDGSDASDPAARNASVVQFDSEAAFVAYLERGRRLADAEYLRGEPVARDDGTDVSTAVEEATATPMATEEPELDAAPSGDAGDGGDGGDAGGSTGAAPVERYSGTNVQVAGIDEPDIVKTNGRQAYYAPRAGQSRKPAGAGATHVLSVSSPAEPTKLGAVPANGRLLLTGDKLVVIEDDRLVGYNVSDPANPALEWTRPVESDVVSARLYRGNLYLVTSSHPDETDPCPITPLGEEAAVACTDVYHPNGTVAADSTYTAFALDPASGTVRDSVSFVGTARSTTVYMSKNALYVTYTRTKSRAQLRLDFLLDSQADALPPRVRERLREIDSYDLSERATEIETRETIRRWLDSLDDQRRRTVEERLREEYRDYLAERQRDLARTGVVRVTVAADDGTPDLSVARAGEVPGRPLDQFSLSEHEGTLRVTTTVPRTGEVESRNDLYVLDNESLDVVGSVQDMGVSQRVYSVRYVGDTAYVVTFRRVDPFHVVDLSDPTDPREVGELKLPGFSSYLHPIDGNHVLGIGEEDGEVKAVLFDVSDPGNPTIDDTYRLDDRWSAISSSHHAFLIDRRHEVFFLPGERGGYVIDYAGGDLELQTLVGTDRPAQRAIYVDDYLYVFAGDEVTVVDETTWDRTTTLDLRASALDDSR